MDDKCRGLFGRIRCNFEARYEAIPMTDAQAKVIADTAPFELSLDFGKRYVCDVCTACGEQRPRPPTREGVSK